jgi:hypothetical protein
VILDFFFAVVTAILGVIVAAIAIVVIALVAPVFAVLSLVTLPAQYFIAAADHRGAERPGPDAVERTWLGRITRITHHVDRRRAFPQYFFGPAETDLRAIVRDTARRIQHTTFTMRMSVTNPFVGVLGYLGMAAVGAVWIGVEAGAIGGTVITLGIAVIHVLLLVLGAAAATVLAALLRCTDGALRYAAGIRMTCPACAEAVRPYAAYECPGCGELHRDIRPGRFGVIQRICICGRRLSTLLLFGASRLTAVCPWCGARLPRRFGRAAEIVVPFFGSIKAGKTQLMYMLTSALSELAAATGGTVLPADDANRDEIERLRGRMSITGAPGPTTPRSPEALVLRASFGASERNIYLFDAAGELHYRPDRLDELRYLDKARTLVFVADPLAADGIWARLTADQQREFSGIRSDWAGVELAYELPREQIRRMGGKGHAMRLAFVVTKADVLIATRIRAQFGSVREMVVDPDGMDLGNIAREAEQSFGHVEYLETAAMTVDAAASHESVEALARQLLRAEGIRLDRL